MHTTADGMTLKLRRQFFGFQAIGFPPYDEVQKSVMVGLQEAVAGTDSRE